MCRSILEAGDKMARENIPHSEQTLLGIRYRAALDKANMQESERRRSNRDGAVQYIGRAIERIEEFVKTGQKEILIISTEKDADTKILEEVLIENGIPFRVQQGANTQVFMRLEKEESGPLGGDYEYLAKFTKLPRQLRDVPVGTKFILCPDKNGFDKPRAVYTKKEIGNSTGIPCLSSHPLRLTGDVTLLIRTPIIVLEGI